MNGVESVLIESLRYNVDTKETDLKLIDKTLKNKVEQELPQLDQFYRVRRFSFRLNCKNR